MEIEATVAAITALATTDYEQFKLVVAELLGHVNPRQPFGTSLFDAIAKVTVTVACENIAMRRGDDGRLYVFLRCRSLDDTAYPGEWHSPGSALRPGETYEDVFRRLRGEFGSDVVKHEQIGLLNVPEEERGHFLTPVFLVEIDGDGRQDDRHGWFPVDALPQPMVAHHECRLFPMAIKAFEERERQQKGDR
ncbi:MAG: hypothetical protein COU32_00995 [Candidatus Magasanikbacteria bacterium CG10_big_fil_rev_8_21_14_0_10_42_10]|uniref:Nudix hydrolase domain-containing protein n=1 Tax=Candidatus Magasanikbacteria bacterium CG10_big_fil_rev_8_21_14_0_10_42_10 TaxID=1974649 RepID=A0A2H0TZ07_9BACT|nr:MAG: hypothetical protein COU32_00995 [Candidatus Magasanikbacteria bacterium CG10_big_fil_rev_8_21_14_0_10_42_10]